MNLTIHRGTHQIGGTCVEVESNGNHVLLDIGLPLDSDIRISALGPAGKSDGKSLVRAGILPDIPGIYKWDPARPLIKAVLVTHPHLDHYGILSYIKPDIPVFMGKNAWAIIAGASSFLSGTLPFSGKVHEIAANVPFSIAGFRVMPYLMDHSAFDSYAYHVAAGNKSLLYTGDFRSHGRKSKAFYWFLKNVPKGVDALLIEGTMLSRTNEKVPSEKDLELKIASIALKTKNLVMAYCSSQNIDRLVTFYRSAVRSKKMFVVDIYTAHMLAATGKKSVPVPGTAFPDIRVYYPWKLSTRVAKSGKAELLYRFQKAKISKAEIREKRSRIVMLVRPSAKKDLEVIGKLKDAVLIYSLWEGYLKEKYVRDFVEWLEMNGAARYNVHTSGHATIDALKKTVTAVMPGRIIPVHTENPDIYKKLFPNVTVMQDRECLVI